MATGILRVKGDKIVDENGNTVILRGAAVGGWMKYVFSTFFSSILLASIEDIYPSLDITSQLK